MLRWALRLGAAVVVLIIGVWATNASALAPRPDGGLLLLAHRGVHQDFSREGLTNETCTAARMLAPTHDFLENTLPSIEAAFAYGADMVEIDVHPTTDGEYAVFHDWTLECRTDGSGRTRDHAMDALRALDIGYGYTADGGATFPFRGSGVGLTPTLGEVLDAFPDQRFLINHKGNRADDAPRLATYLAARPNARPERLTLVAGGRFVEAWRRDAERPPAIARAEARACAKSYVLWGWTGRVPEACGPFAIAAPLDFARLYWGWPRRLVQRARARDLEVMVVGPTVGPTDGVDTIDQLRRIPPGFSGWIVTNKIEVIGPAAAGSDPSTET